MSKFIIAVRLVLKDLLSQRRNRLIMFAIGFGAFFMVVGGGYNSGMKHQLLELMHDGYTGDVTIVSETIKLEPSPMPLQVGWKDMLNGKQDILDRLKNDVDIKDLLGRLVLYGNVMGSDDSINEYVTVVGCDFQVEDKYTFRKLLKFEKEPILEGNSVYVSKKIAEKLNLKIGANIYIFLVDQNEMIRPTKFRVGGIFTGKGFPAVVESLVYVDYADLRAALRLPELYYSSILIMLEDKSNINITSRRIREIIPSEWVLVSPDISGSFFKGIYNMIDITTNISNILMYLLIFLFVYSILLMNINGRRREIGIMSSLGISNQQVLFIFMGEGTLLGLVPAIIGSFLGLVLVFVFTRIGIPAMNDAMKYMFASDMLYFKVNITAILNATIVIPFIAFLGSILPTYKILKMKIIESLKNI